MWRLIWDLVGGAGLLGYFLLLGLLGVVPLMALCFLALVIVGLCEARWGKKKGRNIAVVVGAVVGTILWIVLWTVLLNIPNDVNGTSMVSTFYHNISTIYYNIHYNIQCCTDLQDFLSLAAGIVGGWILPGAIAGAWLFSTLADM